MNTDQAIEQLLGNLGIVPASLQDKACSAVETFLLERNLPGTVEGVRWGILTILCRNEDKAILSWNIEQIETLVRKTTDNAVNKITIRVERRPS